MMLGTKSRYAVMAMVELAQRGNGVPVALSALAESQQIPLPYLEQIFARLRKAALVEATRGPGGGYMLAKAPADIRVAEIVHASDEAIKMTRCENHDSASCLPSGARCATHHLWEGLEAHIQAYLHGITLGDLTKPEKVHV